MDYQGISEKSSSSSRRSACAKNHILIVDDDSTSLLIISSLLRSWKCEVETAQHPEDALAIVRAKQGSFDLVMTDYHMPNMNGLQLQKKVQEEFRLPVIIMSCDDRKTNTWEKLGNGASFYMTKPVKIKELKYVWKYAITGRKGKGAVSDIPRALLLPDMSDHTSYNEDVSDFVLPMSEHGNKKQKQKQKQSFKDIIPENQNTTKGKTKLVWTAQLHNRFLQAINLVGIDRSVPKTIVELMNVPGLTREHVASHLQKYRIFLKRAAEKGASPDSKMYIHGKASSSSKLAQTSFFSSSSSTRQDVLQECPVLNGSVFFPSSVGLGFGGISSIMGDSSIHPVPSLNQQASRSTNSTLSNIRTNLIPSQVGTQNALSNDTNTIFQTIIGSSTNRICQPTRNFSSQQGLNISNQTYQQQLEQARPNFSGIGYPDCSSIMSGIPNHVQPFSYGEFRRTRNISSASSSHPARSNFGGNACLTGNRERFGVNQDGINGKGNNGFPIVDLDYLLSSCSNYTAEIQPARTNAGENGALSGAMNNASLPMTNNYEQLLDEGNVNNVFMRQVNCEIPTKQLAGENTGEIHLPEINNGDNVTQLNSLTRQLQSSSFSNLLLAPWDEEPLNNEHQAMDIVAEEFASNYSFPLMDQYHNQEQVSGDLPAVVPSHMNQEWDEDFVRALLDPTS